MKCVWCCDFIDGFMYSAGELGPLCNNCFCVAYSTITITSTFDDKQNAKAMKCVCCGLEAKDLKYVEDGPLCDGCYYDSLEEPEEPDDKNT